MKELAKFLKTERINRNLTLEAISERSGISVSMLNSFEECDFERFGASLLIRSIVNAYCRVLQIEADPLIQKFSHEIQAYNFQDAGRKQMKIGRKKRRMIALPVFALILISAVLIYGSMRVSEKRLEQTIPPNADRGFIQKEFPAEVQQGLAPGSNAGTKKAGADIGKTDEAMRTETNSKKSEITKGNVQEANNTQQSAIQASDADVKPDKDASGRQLALSNSSEAAGADKPTSANDANRRGNRFAVEAVDKVWIQVRIDDKETRSTMLHPGDRREWAADKSMQVVIGNAGGIHMKWNDEPLKAPRNSGRVLRFRLPEYAKAAGPGLTQE